MTIPHRPLGAHTSPELAGRRWIVVVPLGSLEQHGPHLPLDTDTRIAVALATEAAAGLDRTVVAPAVTYGASGEHAGFAGTLSIGHVVLEQVLVELCRSAGEEVAAICFVNGHGGNHEALRAALRTIAAEGRRAVGWSPPAVRGGDAHAGRVETSVLAVLAPELVRSAVAAAGNTEPLVELLPRLRAGGVASVSPNGVLGDPAGASPEEGAIILSGWVDDLRSTLRALGNAD